MTMKDVAYIDLKDATEMAIQLAALVGAPLVVAGGLALAAYGYRRETHDVDMVLSAVAISGDLDVVAAKAESIGMTVKSRHSFGGLDLRHGDIRIDVLTLGSNDELRDLIADAVVDAVEHPTERTVNLFGHPVLAVSLGHLIAMKLVSARKKDLADIVEVIKAQMAAGVWAQEQIPVRAVVKRHLGWYVADRVLGELIKDAQQES